MSVYVLHWTKEGCAPRHYIGHTNRPVLVRVLEHTKPRSKGYTASLVRAGYTPIVAYVWADGDRTMEFRLKQLGRHVPRFQIKNWCPCCHPKAVLPTAAEIHYWKQQADMVLDRNRKTR